MLQTSKQESISHRVFPLSCCLCKVPPHGWLAAKSNDQQSQAWHKCPLHPHLFNSYILVLVLHVLPTLRPCTLASPSQSRPLLLCFSFVGPFPQLAVAILSWAWSETCSPVPCTVAAARGTLLLAFPVPHWHYSIFFFFFLVHKIDACFLDPAIKKYLYVRLL